MHYAACPQTNGNTVIPRYFAVHLSRPQYTADCYKIFINNSKLSLLRSSKALINLCSKSSSSSSPPSYCTGVSSTFIKIKRREAIVSEINEVSAKTEEETVPRQKLLRKQMSLFNCACSSKESYLGEDTFDKRPAKKKLMKPKDQQSDGEKEVCRSPSKMNTQDSINFQPDSNHYELFALIGKGHSNTSSISLTRHVPSDTLVSVKRINLEIWDGELSYLQNEIILTQQLSHPNVLPFYCSFISGQELWAVMPLMAFGSCRDLIHAYFNSGLPEQAIQLILREVLLAVEYIHQRGIIHRGIKASHVMISQSGQVCLSGLHNSLNMIQNGRRLRRVHEFPLHTLDCLHCYSPELLEQNLSGYSCESDIYSIGILTCELANGQSPFSDMPATQMLLEKLSGTKPRLADATTVGEFYISEDEVDDQSSSPQERADAIFFRRTFSPHLHDFTSVCLEKDPHLRPTASQLLHHPLFKSIRNKSSSILPSLLQPVSPLTDITRAPRDATAEDEDFTRKMSEVSMHEEWTF